MPPSRSLVGSVVERNTESSPLRPVAGARNGFPAVEHRSKSAFARSRTNGDHEQTRPKHVPIVIPSTPTPPAVVVAPLLKLDSDDWRSQISAENERKVGEMTEEEREREREEIIERFGSGIGNLLKRAKAAREKATQSGEIEVVDAEENSPISHKPEIQPGPNPKLLLNKLKLDIGCGRSDLAPGPPSALVAANGSRPPSRSGRKIRFAEITPKDVHVYESAPSSPRKKAMALMPPPDIPDLDGPAISLGKWNGRMVFDSDEDIDDPADLENGHVKGPHPEEGTPEDIRRRFFPNAPSRDPNLAWMEVGTPVDSNAPTLRFDLSGNPISQALSSTLPTHLGLHHHADGAHAGYTLDDIFLLSRSSVPAQRASMLSVLSKIAANLAKMKKKACSAEGLEELAGKEGGLRKRILAAGIEAVNERGSLGARAVEVIWECLVGWDADIIELEGMELQTLGDVDDPITSLPLDFFLPQIASLLSFSGLPAESRTRLLAIIDRLAQHSNEIASQIVKTPKLVATIVQTFLLTPIPPTDASSLPNPAALQTLITLSLSSRENALSLVEPADALLRFITMLPPSSPFSLELTISLLTSTLWLYTTLASYGMYASIAATASAQFNALSSYILSENCRSVRLGAAWAGLVGAWMVCATDPHRTTPSHDILWSQIVGWGWCGDVLELRGKLGVGEREREVWCSVWGALTAWLEGARVNGVKRGETERAEMISAISSGFESGSEKEIVGVAIVGIRQCLSSESLNLAQLRECATHADVLAAAIQLWLACVSHTTDGPPDSPPFAFPFSHISELCAALVTHPLWSAPLTTPHSRVACRSLTSLLSTYLLFSRRLPDTTQELWMAQAFSVLCRLLPGDEEFGVLTVTGLVGMITPELLSSRGWTVPSAIWQRGGLEVITPFLTHSIQTREGAYIGPLHMTPTSISLASTQRLPPINNPSSDRGESLPLTKDWVLSPLNHLLRSGTSTVFKYLPPSWDANEIDVTRATLLLAKIAREILGRFALRDFLLTREETVFGCMKVFMLEHEQAHNGAGGEVFRDGIVGGFMGDLIAPFTVKARPADANTTNAKPSDDLEKVASRFLGSSTPFYQYYTDFIALYDAISFSHPLFASLLLPPLSMRYAIDYRKLFWNDYGHVLKTIRTPVDQVVAKDLKEFLWPIESDSQVLSAQLRCLVKGSLHEFLRFLAVHHIASNVWPDLRCGNGSGNVVGNDEGAGRLLKAVMQQSPPDVVRDVLRYRQTQAYEGPVVLVPECYEQIGEFGGRRVEFALRWADVGMAECVERLLGEA